MKVKKSKILCAICFAIACMGVVAFGQTDVKAATDVKIHVKEYLGWGSINVYNWGDDGEILGAWPGTAMTAGENGWYDYTISCEKKLNLVFCVDADGNGETESQASDCKDMDPAKGEYWIVVAAGDGKKNDMGIASAAAPTVFEAEPTEEELSQFAAPEVTETEAPATVAPATVEPNTDDAATDDAKEATTDKEDSSDSNNVLPIVAVVVAVIVVIGVVVVVVRKKK